MSARARKKPHKAAEGPGLKALYSSPLDYGRAGRLREIFFHLSELNKTVPIIVEGKRDAAALRGLGFEGEVIILHSGKSIYDFSEEIIARLDKVVLLLDWDDKGESLTRTLQECLEGRAEEFSFFRETIRFLCQKDIKDIEGVPILLRRLEGIAGPSRPQDKWE